MKPIDRMNEKPIFIFPQYLLIAILNSLIFNAYLKSTGLPGGAVGMIPLVVMLFSLITFITSLIIFLILLKQKINLNSTKYILLYQSIYLIVLIVAGQNPFEKGLEKEFKEITIWIYFASFLATASLIIILWFLKIVNRRRQNI
ncbi:hypothetical protein [Flavobacterium caeni]|uniref:Uncharacterized protein n=1 Tax=Flavobacterium caeni TaxID=490189 RepID=A0A1G5KG45_9FLAO|nr:hypothetical protein [Flavobacterium caeni]SCY98939.1 hypothetical protein SAMN02927903_03260 [Flavobacterium caeni]